MKLFALILVANNLTIILVFITMYGLGLCSRIKNRFTNILTVGVVLM